MRWIIVAATAAAMAACVPPAASGDTSAVVVGDSVAGAVAIVGSDPRTMVAVRRADGTDVVLGGAAESQLRRVAGAEVVAFGHPVADGMRSFSAERFIVRAVDGRPARDGILETDGDALLLRLVDGSRSPIVDPPATLRTHVGARVWLAGPASASPEAWGVIGAP